mgnify:CR=1 FL=1
MKTTRKILAILCAAAMLFSLAACGSTTNASNLTVETSGNSSAAIRSDRGGGTVNVTGGTYTSNGYNCYHQAGGGRRSSRAGPQAPCR